MASVLDMTRWGLQVLQNGHKKMCQMLHALGA